MSGAIEDLTAAVQAQTKQIEQLAATLATLTEKIAPARETWTLRDISTLPEAPSLRQLYEWRRVSPWKLPGAGKPDGFARDGVQAWRRETVEAWRRDLAPTAFGKPRGRPLKAAS